MTYVSVYNFGQSENDGTTVPLYYENRIPELQLINDNLNEAMEHIIEEAALDDSRNDDWNVNLPVNIT